MREKCGRNAGEVHNAIKCVCCAISCVLNFLSKRIKKEPTAQTRESSGNKEIELDAHVNALLIISILEYWIVDEAREIHDK